MCPHCPPKRSQPLRLESSVQRTFQTFWNPKPPPPDPRPPWLHPFARCLLGLLLPPVSDRLVLKPSAPTQSSPAPTTLLLLFLFLLCPDRCSPSALPPHDSHPGAHVPQGGLPAASVNVLRCADRPPWGPCPNPLSPWVKYPPHPLGRITLWKPQPSLNPFNLPLLPLHEDSCTCLYMGTDLAHTSTLLNTLPPPPKKIPPAPYPL